MNIESVFKRFPTQSSCLAYIEKIRWGESQICPYCGSMQCSVMKKENGYEINRYHCNKCNATFSVLVNTIFQNTKLELQKWFLAVAIVLNAKKNLSSRQLARDLKVNHKTAWSMQIKINRAVCQNDTRFLQGIISWVKHM